MAHIIAVTACPTGIAHTIMAAEGLEQAAQALGHTIQVETQGSVGVRNALSEADIAAADVVIIAADTRVDTARFADKPLYETSDRTGDPQWGRGDQGRAGQRVRVIDPCRCARCAIRHCQPEDRRHHFLSDRHRAYLHGRRRSGAGREKSGPCDQGGNPGFGRGEKHPDRRGYRRR